MGPMLRLYPIVRASIPKDTQSNQLPLEITHVEYFVLAAFVLKSSVEFDLLVNIVNDNVQMVRSACILFFGSSGRVE